ncbi:MAG: hypothetical protein ACRCUD_06505 [Cetobacterium sp.]
MRYLVLFYIVVSITIFPMDRENIIDGNMDLKINNFKEEFYPLYIDEIKEEGYLGLKALFNSLELNELYVDLNKLEVIGELPNKEKISWKFDGSVAFIENDDIYINLNNLNEIFPVKNIKFDLNMLNIEIKLGFKLPSDIRYEQEVKRKNILKKSKLETQKNDYKTNKSLITPGVVQIQYEQTSFSEGDTNSLDIKYSSQLFYGEFQSDITLFNERTNDARAKINTATLRYNNIFDEKDLVVGSFYMRVPSVYNIDTDMNGISISDSSDRYNLMERGGNTFEGYAPDGSVVELYRNGILLDYQTVNEQKYIFTGIDLLSLTDRYYIRIYEEDGSYIQKDLSLLMNNKALVKNRWSYSIQSGKVRGRRDENFLGTLKYGLTNNLTLEFGHLNLTSDREKRIYKENLYGFIYNSSPIKFPFWISGNWYHDLNKKDGSLFLEFGQNVYDYRIEGVVEKYSKRISEQEKKDEIYRINIKKSIKNINYGLGYEIESYKGNKYNNYTGGIGYNYKYLSNGLEYTFQEYTENSLRNKHRFKYQLGMGGFDILNVTSSIEYKFNHEWELEEDKYSLKFIKRNSNYYSSKKIDFSVNFAYSEKSRDKFLSELSFTLYLEEFGLPFSSAEMLFSGNDKNQKRLGTKIKKTIILQEIDKNSKMKNIVNSWIKGKVFIDSNGNGKYDDLDEVLDGIDITVQGKKTTTDNNGDYFIENISAETTFTLKVDKTYIDPLLYFDETIHYRLMPSTGMIINIPLQNTTSISGNILLKSEEINEGQLPFIYNKVVLILKKNNNEIRRLKPEFDGFFICDGLIDGEYEVEIQISDKNYYFEKNKYQLIVNSLNNDSGIYKFDDFILLKKEEVSENYE